MKRLLILAAALLFAAGAPAKAGAAAKTKSATPTKPAPASAGTGFIAVKGVDMVDGKGNKFFIRGTNLGQWLNPEGYMFGFQSQHCGPYWMINAMFSQLVGPEFTAQFWREFRENFITKEDIAFIARTGSNTIRLPLHYKLFTGDEYMGSSSANDGFETIDKVVSWCRAAGIYVILDMHDAPGGNSGIWVDDSYGYPWLFESPAMQQQLVDIWQAIAARYKDEPVVLGYDLLNEPIYNNDQTKHLNPLLEGVYKKVVQAIRKVDKNHIIILGGAHCNSKFEGVFTDWKYDGNLMWQCHHYGGKPVIDPIQKYIDWRDKTGMPMYMGEIGHNSLDWIYFFRNALEQNNIGWTFWTYKYTHPKDGFVSITMPAGWNAIRTFANSPRTTFDEIRTARPDQAAARQALNDYLEAIKFKNCAPNREYLQALGLKND